MIDHLRETLERQASLVTPKPGPYPRLVRRRQRQRWAMTAAVVTCLLLAPAAFLWLRSQVTPGYVYVPGDPPVQALLDSPVRGSLATDTAYLGGLRAMAALGAGMTGERLPDNPDRLKVLFAGDLGQRRVAVVAGLDGTPSHAVYQGAPGDAPESLRLSSVGELPGVVNAALTSDSQNPDNTFLLLGPSGVTYEVAQTEYTGTSLRRTWANAAPGTDYLGFGHLGQTKRFRVVAGGDVLAETMAGPPVNASVVIDPQPVAGRGTPAPAAASQLAGSLAAMTGLTPPGATFRVLWSEELDMPGTPAGRAYVVTVQAVVTGGDSGGPYLTGAYSVGDNLYREHPSGYGLAGDVATALIVMRLPSYTATSERLQIVGPPSGVRAEVTWDGSPTTIDLVNGAGHLTVPPGEEPVVRVFDSAGNLLATKRYAEVVKFECDRFDPTACSTTPSTGPTP